MRQAAGSPLTWLGGLLVAYLAVPTVAFVIRFAGSSNRGFASPGLWGALRVSVVGASIATAAITVLGVPLAYALARAHGRVGAAVGVVVQLPLALPPLMSGILLIYLFGPYTTLGRLFGGRLTNSLTGVVLAQAFVAAPFLVVAARSAFAALDPALDDVAATLGHPPLARFALVGLPVAAPAIAAGMLLTWLRAFGEYGATVLLAYHPYSLPVFTDVQFSGVGLSPTQAPTALALLIAAAAIVLSQLRMPRRRRRPAGAAVPAACGPATAAAPGTAAGTAAATGTSAAVGTAAGTSATVAAAVGFDLHATVGTFDLRVHHPAGSHRLAILGPSGSGKSLTLRALAGLLGGEVGSVEIAGRPLDHVATEHRRIGLVPQGLGLLPRRTVWQQVTFGVGTDPALASWWLGTLRLRGLEDRLPHELSGGQRQRVSVAQALSRRPDVVLLDEPFSALDAPVREELRQELRRLQLEAGLSTVLVTHDPAEAAILADEVVVIADGAVLQDGPVEAVLLRPASPAVARLIGVGNLLTGHAVQSPVCGVSAGPALVRCTHDLRTGTPVEWAVRPEQVRMGDTGPLEGVVDDVAFLGAVTVVRLRLADGEQIEVRHPGRPTVGIGARRGLDMDPGAVMVWAAAGVGAGAGAPQPVAG